MILRRFFLFLTVAFLLFLGLYTWNRKTNFLDAIATHTGLETTGTILRPYNWIIFQLNSFWNNYLDLVDVRAENDRLHAQLADRDERIASLSEDHLELARLRGLFSFSTRLPWEKIGARVIGCRMGPFAALESVMLDKGFANGALPGTPVIALRGLAGKVLRASAHTSTVMLVTNSGFRVAVVSQRRRIPAIVSGAGPDSPLDVKYIPPNAEILPGEMLITSGIDGNFPKGIPVGIVSSITPPAGNPFLTVSATPLAQIRRMEEVLLLQRPLAEETPSVAPPLSASPPREPIEKNKASP